MVSNLDRNPSLALIGIEVYYRRYAGEWLLAASDANRSGIWPGASPKAQRKDPGGSAVRVRDFLAHLGVGFAVLVAFFVSVSPSLRGLIVNSGVTK